MPSASMSGMRLCGSNPPGLPVLILHRIGRRYPCRAPDRADPPDGRAGHRRTACSSMTSRSLAVLLLDDPGRPVAELGIDVFVPEIERLEDVTVGIDDIVNATP